MRSIVLDLGGYEANKPRVEAFLTSCRAAGLRVFAAGADPSAWPWRMDSIAFAVTCGMHDREAAGRVLLAAAGVPVVVLDLGYVRRASRGQHDGYHQVGIGRLGWLPPFLCPGDRLQELEILVEEPADKPGRRILVLGQVPWDSQHHMNGSQISGWLRRRVRGLRRLLGEKREVVLRPHPEDPRQPEWGTTLSTIETAADVDLETAVRKSAAVVTYNSTAAVEAVRQGVPVICHPTAHYAETAWCPSKAHRTEYFRRLAYAQWNLAELRDGAALKFIRGVMGR